MIPYAHVFSALVLVHAVSVFPARAQQFDVQVPLALSRIVIRVDQGVIDRRFMQDLADRLRAMFVAPVDARDAVVDSRLLETKGFSGRADATPLLKSLSASIDWQQEAGAYHVLLIAQDMRLAPDSFNFAASMGGLSIPSRVGVVSLSRLQKQGLGGLDEAPYRTAVRIQKLIARSIVRTSGYPETGACLQHMPTGLAVLDALPESFCEPDLSNWVAAGLLRAAPR